ncbi:MAG: molybdopterin-synthase adenylyltransferase MoeB [Gammaproteobacteria bacterium]|nr:MAG: molybdopterin-synthase adenylyltransferase MoeB [Gammaproteobacteria bacterium]
MNDEQLLRYSRQILLPQLDIAGQQKIMDGHVLIIGLGGLGSPVAMYLAAAGVGHLTLVDDDEVELSNLQRQILHRQQDIGRSKVDSAKDTVQALNRDVQLQLVAERLQGEALEEAVNVADVIVDCSDNFATRFLLNEITQRLKKPLVSGAAIRMEGQVTIFDSNIPDSACYRCLYQDNGELQETCSETGVISPLLGIIGSVQAMESLKLLAGIGETLAGRLLILDAFKMEWHELRLRQDPSCPVCQQKKAH